MPHIINSDGMDIKRGEGWVEITIADSESFGTPAMVARRLVLEPGAKGPERVHGDTEQLLYVIRGSGKAVVDEVDFQLNDESVLWLDSGETYRFVAGNEGLEILQGYAPGE